MRVATCNILHGVDVRRLSPGATELPPDAVNLKAVADWIAGLDADVVALQEVDHCLSRSGGVDQAAWLADRLGYEAVFGPALAGNPDRAWEEVPADGLAPGAEGYGVAILSRVGLGEATTSRLPHGGAGTREPGASPVNPGVDREPRVKLSATVGDGVRVSTTHLSYMFWRALPQLGRALEAAADGHDGPGVFVGDVNLPSWGGGLAMRLNGLHPLGWPAAATRAAGWRHVAGGPTYPSWKPRVQLDQAFLRHVSGRVYVSVGPAGPSDHLPLVVDL